MLWCVCVCVYVDSFVSTSATPWTICSPPGSSVHGIFQARVLEWVAISYLTESSRLLGTEPASLVSPALAGRFFTTSISGEAPPCCYKWYYFFFLWLSNIPLCINVIVVQSLSRVRLFATPQTAAHQASLSFTISPNFLKLMSIESMMPSSHLIHVIPFSSCPQSFPASGPFPVSWFFI